MQLAGIDVGGTFTDLIYVTPDAVHTAKVPSTPENQADGVLAALEAAAVELALLDSIVHGTTVTTNAVLERKLSRTGLITTQGFRDVLELGRRTRPQPYGLTGQFVPLIDRELRLEVPERLDARGNVLTPLDEAAVVAAARALADAGCESLVIHFLHAYANDAHELRAAEIARAEAPGLHVTVACELLSEYREYERGVTAAVNARVQPVLKRYLDRLGSSLRERGFASELLIMRGNGGTVSADIASAGAVHTVMSGPASGVMAAAYTARSAGVPHLLTYDMGGTSCDVGLIRDGLPVVSSELEIEYAMPIHVPMVDVHTIGAGGGSIAWVDDSGLLRVGPQSAGARPGPICYGRGGDRVTVTDANLVLGRLNPQALMSVANAPSVADIEAAFKAQVGAPLALSGRDAAAAVLRVANDRMAGALRLVSLERGHDPRDLALFAFGGAGPLHAVELAREIGVPTVLVPARPGLTNALGCVVADIRHEFVRTVNAPLSSLHSADLRAMLDQQAEAGRALVAKEKVPVTQVRVVTAADMQFQGQTHLLRVAFDAQSLDVASLQQAFETAYLKRFHVELSEIRAVLVNLHTTVIGERPALDIARLASDTRDTGSAPDGAAPTMRSVAFDGAWRDTPILARHAVAGDEAVHGPAIIEQSDTTIVIPPGASARADAVGNLLIHPAACSTDTKEA